MRCDGCFLSCKPEARRPGFIEPIRGRRSIPAGADAPTSGISISVTAGIINARAARSSHKLGQKRTGGYKAFLSILQRACDSTRLGWRL